MEIFEIAVRRQAKESQDSIELRARIGSRESVEEVINGLDAIIYTHLGVRQPLVQTPTTVEYRETITVSEPTEEEVEATEPATQDPPPVKAKRKYSKRVTLAEDITEAQPVTDAVVQEVAEINDLLVAEPVVAPVVEPVVTPTPAACMVDFDLLSMDEEPAPQPAVVNVAKLKVPEVVYEHPKPVQAPLVATKPLEVQDPLKLQKRIQDAIASRVISPEPVLSLMHARGFNSTRETDEACRIAILELIIAAEAKK